jgi:hypothetical protein
MKLTDAELEQVKVEAQALAAEAKGIIADLQKAEKLAKEKSDEVTIPSTPELVALNETYLEANAKLKASDEMFDVIKEILSDALEDEDEEEEVENKPSSKFRFQKTTTFQPPSEKEEFEVEQLEPTKDRIYNALYNIKKAIPDGFNAMTDLIFEGRNLVLQPTILTGLPQNNLDAYAVDRIKRSATFRKTGKGQKGVTEANEMIAMVLVDKDTNRFVLFDEDGRVTDDTENGKIVYQFLRDTRIENGKYRVTDIYEKLKKTGKLTKSELKEILLFEFKK